MWDENLPQRLDRLIASGAIRPMIVVMPDCATRLGGSQYINSAATGRYQDHLTEELVPVHRSHLSDARAARRARRHGQELGRLRRDHPRHAACPTCSASWSTIPATSTSSCATAPTSRAAAPGWHRIEHPPSASSPPSRIRRQSAAAFWFDVVNMLAMASCYSPNGDSPIGFDLPFDPYTAELRADVWQRWLAHDPIHLVAAARRRAALAAPLLSRLRSRRRASPAVRRAHLPVNA